MTIATVATVAMLSSCADDKEEGGKGAPDNDTELTVSGISDTEWTYISLESNSVVGRSAKDDPGADAEWAKRADWDIAICGDMLRSNSGTSGNANGGIRRIDSKRYGDVTAADAATVDADRPNAPDAERE